MSNQPEFVPTEDEPFPPPHYATQEEWDADHWASNLTAEDLGWIGTDDDDGHDDPRYPY